MGVPDSNSWAASMKTENPRQPPARYEEGLYEVSTAPQPLDDQPPSYDDIFAGSSAPREYSDSKNLPLRPAVQSYQSSGVSQDRSTSYGSSDSDDEVLQQALEFTHHAPPQQISSRGLRRPVAIPQVLSGIGQPFARGYSQDLHEPGITMQDFVEFIDNFNVVSAGSPPLQIIDMAGGVVGLIPIHHAQIISGAIQAVGKIGKAAVSKTRGTLFIQKANKDFFNPRGLKVELVTSEALKARSGMDPDMQLAAPFEHSADLSVHQRRMAALDGYTAPVTFDVPPPNEETNVLNKMCAAQQKRTIAKQEKKVLEDRDKYAEKRDEFERKDDKNDDKLLKESQKLLRERQKLQDKTEREVAKIERECNREAQKKPKEAEKIERKREKETQKIQHEFDKEIRKLDKESNKLGKEHGKEGRKVKKDAQKEDKEIKSSNKILWILVDNLEGDH